jgi:hypothetical protein
MANIDQDRNKLKNLKHLESCGIHYSDDGYGEVYLINDVFVLFDIPQYGGVPFYSSTFHYTEIENLLKEVYTWT